jgi:serine/threonine protein kinase
MQPNTILADRYQILEQLNYQTSRQTFVAQNIQSQDLVVIKIILFNTNLKWEDYKLFEREAITLQNLHHPAIPEYLDYFELDEPDCRGFALVQTYIDAPSLETVIKSGRKFSEAEVIELADRILTILTYLHEQIPSVIHRDIKPSNILLGNRSGNSVGDIYLVDFGSVKTTASTDGSTITIVGSAGYISMEQFSGKTVTASDLYSLGMTVIYLLTGVHPTELTQVNGYIKFTAEISDRLYRWVEKMTQPYLDKRFDSARLAQIALTSEDGSYSNFVCLKPANTQVQLDRDRNKLEIVWSDIDREKVDLIDTIASIPSMLTILLFSIGLTSIFLSLSISWMSSIASWALLGAVLTTFIIIPISVILAAVTKEFIEKANYKLVIDDRYIYRCKFQAKYQGFKILSQHPRCQIEALVYNPGYTFDKYFDIKSNAIRRGNVIVPPKLYLSGGNFEYQSPDRLSQAELCWLGQELGDFLNLELQIIYPTPIVPPASSC